MLEQHDFTTKQASGDTPAASAMSRLVCLFKDVRA
jgi:hypothetical protein